MYGLYKRVARFRQWSYIAWVKSQPTNFVIELHTNLNILGEQQLALTFH
jgi:hypothetical protein